jgi:hypothetical protein
MKGYSSPALASRYYNRIMLTVKFAYHRRMWIINLCKVTNNMTTEGENIPALASGYCTIKR